MISAQQATDAFNRAKAFQSYMYALKDSPETLREEYATGMITLEELEQRLEACLRS